MEFLTKLTYDTIWVHVWCVKELIVDLLKELTEITLYIRLLKKLVKAKYSRQKIMKLLFLTKFDVLKELSTDVFNNLKNVWIPGLQNL